MKYRIQGYIFMGIAIGAALGGGESGESSDIIWAASFLAGTISFIAADILEKL
jgi:hypothetical protein